MNSLHVIKRAAACGVLALASFTCPSLLAQAQYAGTYIGTINTRVTVPVVGTIESGAGAYIANVSADGTINLSGVLTGTVSATGAVTFTGGTGIASLNIRSATIANNQLSSAYGDPVAGSNGTTSFRLNPSTGFTPATGGGGGGTGGGGTGGGGTGGGGTGGTPTAFANGSFEGGPNPGSSWVTLSNGSTAINGWTVSSGNIDYIGTAWQSSDGNRSLDLAGAGAGGIAQTFATTAGTTYTVTFDLAGNPGYGRGTGVKNLRVSVNNAANTSQEFSFDTTGRTLASMGWVNRTFTFTASGASTTLTFTSLTGGVYGPALDNVKVNGSGGSVGQSVTAGVAALNAATAPATLVGYRNKVNQTFEFTVTGTNSGSLWGTDVYTDDSHVAAAAVHAGVLRAGETKTVTITILPGQSSYPGSSRNGVTSSSWGAWSGSYSFAGAGAVTAANTVPAAPTIPSSFRAGTFAVATGGRLVIPITVSGAGPFTYQWYLNNVLIPGATTNPYVIDSLAASHAGTYSVVVSNGTVSTTRVTAATVTVNPTGAPTITLHPLSKTVAPGTVFTLLASAQGAGNTFQWFRNGVALAGETQNALLRQNVNANDAGNYTVRITNSAGSVTSNAATVTISPTASRPANISCRTFIAAGQIVTPGFVVQGLPGTSKRVLIRAIGPGLATFGLSDTMPNPKLEVFRGNTRLTENDDWNSSIAPTAAALGAFPLEAGSRDAAIVVNLPAGPAEAYTVQVSGVGDSSGIVLIEVYDADTPSTSTSKLVNVSVRGHAGTDANILILGFVLQGTGQRTLLVRGIGPKLAAFGVPGTLSDPKLEIWDTSSPARRVLINDDWNRADYQGEMALAADFVGAFTLDQDSKDASTLALLDPGAYTVQVSGADGGTGETLVEVYEVP